MKKPLNKYIFYGGICVLITLLIALFYILGYQTGIERGIKMQEEFVKQNYFLIIKP